MRESYLVRKVKEPVDWTVEVPGSKSMTNRALLIAALSEGTVQIEGVLFSEDSRYFMDALRTLGFEIVAEEEKKCVTVTGCGGAIPIRQAEIYVGSAGTAARFLTAMLGFSDGSYVIQASAQMKRRPMQPLFDLLKQAGAQVVYLEEEGRLPVQIKGCQKKVIHPLSLEIDISKSTQFLSALLLVAPMIRQSLFVHVTSEKTDGAYIRITRKMMREFGISTQFDGRDYRVLSGVSYQKGRYIVEPDMSAACYFYGAAAVTGGRVLVKRVYMNNTQGDLKFLSVLEDMGCTVIERDEGIEVNGPSGGKLRGITVDMNDFSDQALTLAAIAPFADDIVRMIGIGHIRLQESDRIHAIAEELSKLGVVCTEQEDAVTIYPGLPQSGTIETYEDHRVAMAFSLIGLRVWGIRINNPACCKKTFEEYFQILSRLTE